MRIQRHQTRKPTNIKIHHQHNRQKLREKLIREKTLNLKTTMDLVIQDSYEEKHEQSTLKPELAKEKEIGEEPKQKIYPRNKHNYLKNAETTPKNNNCGFCGQQNWTPSYKCPAKRWNTITGTKEDTLREHAAAKPTIQENKESTTLRNVQRR